MSSALRIPEAVVHEALARVLVGLGLAPPRAAQRARLFTEPGERVLETRAESRRLGVPVDAAVRDEILHL